MTKDLVSRDGYILLQQKLLSSVSPYEFRRPPDRPMYSREKKQRTKMESNESNPIKSATVGGPGRFKNKQFVH